MSNPSLVIVLVEDEHHRMLIYRYLKNCGLRPHDMRISPCPVGRGSAEGWVLQRFSAETSEYRKREARASTALIVMVDADTHTVEERLSQLDQALRDGGEKSITRNERIARLVPRRNVETWILCLNDKRDLDENADYKRHRHKSHKLIPPAAERLCQWTQSKTEPPAHCISSLRIGVQELRRLGF